ncbi:Vacuolar membrane protease [Erysiphe neolycopersici]|uniref:Peptide hydrolase n=1 Tax=Erysiphe neolycopersici TaxID=212602 RepID=A0A420HFD0_9PEZI|nr:Vacuolar membrane protease [Erysiphe neolycopersici]
MRYHKLLTFFPLTITLITTIIYLSITTSLLIIHETVPSPPKDLTSYQGFNLSEAWYELQELSNGYHPFNSRRNDEVRNWLLLKIKETLDTSNTSWELEKNDSKPKSQPSKYLSVDEDITSIEKENTISYGESTKVFVFDDLTANFTSTDVPTKKRKVGTSKYFEGSNIIVYIRGTKDQQDDWWKPSPPYIKHHHGRAGILVNAHFDSVSTGYGTTDDGVGIITALQLLKFFITKGNEPERGLVLLFNNNEEDGLYGSKAFLSHPMASFVHTFLNLEGAGAGGRAILFRSTDLEVTRAYSNSPNPFGSVVSADGFSLNFIKSDTDFTVFHAEGYRGLDVAFYRPRSRYHTDEDDVKHTNKASIWHMLSASVETIKYLTTDGLYLGNDQKYEKEIKKDDSTRPKGVWFDLFGRVFIVFGLRTLFAWSLTILITTPLTLLAISYILIRQDKFYLFTRAIKPNSHISEWVPLQGWRGAFRFPIVLLISSSITISAAFLLKKTNPLIIYSSQYSVWCMFLSLYFCIFWLLMAIFNAFRPSALHRIYVLIWMFLLEWILLIVVTVYEDRFQISSGYIFVFNQGAIFLATLIGLCEMFALPKKSSLIDSRPNDYETRDPVIPSTVADTIEATEREVQDGQEEGESQAVEATPLLGNKVSRSLTRTTFSRGYRKPQLDQFNDMHIHIDGNYGYEQKWSSKLPPLTWLLQIFILAPFPLIITEQIGLIIISSINQTGVDGSDLLFPYLATAVFSILIVLPL